MPVSTGIQEPRAKRCKLCDESNHRSEPGSGYWQLQLDRDLVDTISAIYPEWFKNGMAEATGSGMANGGGGGGSIGGAGSPPPLLSRESPPKAVIDTSPILMDQNKESLKVKLLLRRPFDQLVAQGIMPPHKTPAAYHGMRRQLERAKTGDMLKAKIQQRPPRQELERRHILEADPAHVDPSLAERQRKLKKARLADQLNDQLSHRPGPLELIQKNILHTEEPIEQAVKTGRIPYKATSEGNLNRPQHPHSYVTPEEDSQSSEGDLVSPGPSDVLETAAKSAGIVVSLLQPADGTVVVTTTAPVLTDNSEIVFAEMCRSVAAPLLSQASASSPAASLVSSTSTLSPLSSIASPVPSIISQPATPAPPPITLATRAISSSSVKSDAPGKDKNRKKSKSKSTPKTRMIKFHEYKGPPSAQKSAATSGSNGESSYDIMLQQQTLLLQYQLQLQHKLPQFILPASQKATISDVTNNNHLNTQQPSPSPSTSSESSVQTTRISTGRLEDMKVSDLKAELKRRSLPVSGSKPQLIERLKSYSGEILNHQFDSTQSNSSIEQSHNSPPYQNIDSPQESIKEELCMDIGEPKSPDPQAYLQEIQQDHIVREQKKKIDELERKLALQNLQLMQQAVTRPDLVALQKHLQARQQSQQEQSIASQVKHLQALQAKQAPVNGEQQRLQQQQHVAFQNQKNLNGLVLNTADATIFINQLLQGKNGHCRTNSLPNFLNGINIITAPEIKAELIEDVKVNGDVKEDKPPPLYEEATKQIKKNNVKSQIVDDVLEILIKNGELPPSAANDPVTPQSANMIKPEPVFTPQQDQSTHVENHMDNHIENHMDNHMENHIENHIENHMDNHIENHLEDHIDNHLSNNFVIENQPSPDNPLDLLDSWDTLDNMDINQLMDFNGQTQNDNNNDQDSEQMDWFDSLFPNDDVDNRTNNSCLNLSAPLATHESDISGSDPLLAVVPDTWDPFNLEMEMRSPAELTAGLVWDKVDYVVQ